MGVGVYVFSVRCLAVSLAGGRAFSVAIQSGPITPHSEPSQLRIRWIKAPFVFGPLGRSMNEHPKFQDSQHPQSIQCSSKRSTAPKHGPKCRFSTTWQLCT